MSRRPARRPRPTSTPTPPTITVDEANDLAECMILDLAEDVGNPDAIGATLTQWLDREGDLFRFSLVVMAALQTTYAECLTRVPIGAVPPGSTILTTPETETAA